MNARVRDRLVGLAGLAVVALTGVVAGRDLVAVANAWAEMGPLGPGAEIPRFRAQLASGGRFENDALQGEVTMLAFWATWCGVCDQQMPDIEALHLRYADQGLRVLGVNQDHSGEQAELVDAYIAKRDLHFDTALDTGRMGHAFRVSLIPHVVLIDRDGELRHVHQGRVGRETLSDEIAGLLSE